MLQLRDRIRFSSKLALLLSLLLLEYGESPLTAHNDILDVPTYALSCTLRTGFVSEGSEYGFLFHDGLMNVTVYAGLLIPPYFEANTSRMAAGVGFPVLSA